MKKVKLISYLKKYWFFTIISPLFMAGEVVVDLFQPKLMSRIVNTVVGSVQPMNWLANFVFATWAASSSSISST